MAEERAQRRLAAILAADVVGYSRLMEADEAGTLAELRARRKQVVEPLVVKHHGRIFKISGDGVLVEFASAVNAVECAVAIQEGMAAANRQKPEEWHIVLRIGVNLGDVMVEEDDLYGDGVNIAARLESLAERGRIVVSRTVYDHVKNKTALGFTDLGEQRVKNIAEAIRVYRVEPAGAQLSGMLSGRQSLPLPDRPSIVVLPFTNMSGDQEQIYFADGIVEELTSALSRVRSFFVIARNSAFAYRDRTTSVGQIARELGVRYVLEGSVRKSDDRVRITTQLIDAGTGSHIWADRYDGKIADIFDLQDRITEQVVGEIQPTIRSAEIARAKRKRPDSLEAYDYVMRAFPHAWALNPNSNAEAFRLLAEAIRLDPGYALAYALASFCHAMHVVNGWTSPSPENKAEGLRLARRALELDPEDPTVLTMLGAAETLLASDLESAARHIGKAIALDPNSAWAWNRSGYLHAFRCEAATALDHFRRAMRLSPFDPLSFNFYVGAALAEFVAGHDEEALEWAERALAERPELIWAYRLLAVCHAHLGHHALARAAVTKLQSRSPDLSIAQIMSTIPFQCNEARRRYADGLRKAGLPD